MEILGSLEFGGRRRLPVFLQTEAAECGLSCLAAIAQIFGKQVHFGGMLHGVVTLIVVVVVMLVAIVKVHGKNGFFLNMSGTPGKGHGFEFNFVLLMMLLAILVAGAGVLSLDRILRPLGE